MPGLDVIEDPATLTTHPDGDPVVFHCQLHCGTPGPDGMNWLAPGQSLWPVTGRAQTTGVLLDDQELAWTYPTPAWESRLELKALTFWPPTGSRWDGMWWQRPFPHWVEVTPGDRFGFALKGLLLAVPPPRTD